MFEQVIGEVRAGRVPCPALLALLVAVVDGLTAGDLDKVDDAVVGSAVVEVHRQVQRLEGERLRCLAAYDRRVAWQGDGARSVKEWLSVRCGLTRGEAAGQVETARGLAGLPRTAAALAAGTLTVAQARTAARTMRRVEPDAYAGLDAVVAAAAGKGVDSAGVRRAVDDWAYRHDQRLLAGRRDQAHQRRSLTVTRHEAGGGGGEFQLDPLGLEILLTALEPLSARRGEGDGRTVEQRRADALVELARRSLTFGDLPVTGGQPPHVTVVVQADTLAGTPGSPPAVLDHVGAVDGEAARLLACDAAVTRAVMAGASQVLDVGRASRTVSAAQRRALAARDGGCRGCGAPPGWCQAHHITHWAHGGRTDLDNLVLLCWTCHDNVHHHRWRLLRTLDRRWTLHPPGSHPRRDCGDGTARRDLGDTTAGHRHAPPRRTVRRPTPSRREPRTRSLTGTTGVPNGTTRVP